MSSYKQLPNSFFFLEQLCLIHRLGCSSSTVKQKCFSKLLSQGLTCWQSEENVASIHSLAVKLFRSASNTQSLFIAFLGPSVHTEQDTKNQPCNLTQDALMIFTYPRPSIWFKEVWRACIILQLFPLPRLPSAPLFTGVYLLQILLTRFLHLPLHKLIGNILKALVKINKYK